jgi:hypothetical protein
MSGALFIYLSSQCGLLLCLYIHSCCNPQNLQFSLRPFALSHNRHDSRPDPTRSLLECLVRRALLVVKVVIAVVFEDGLRHDGVALAERR